MNLSRNMVLMYVFVASLQGSDGSRLPVSKIDKEKMLKQLKEIIHSLQIFYNTTGTEWVGNPVFSPYLDQMNSRASCTCQTMLLDRILKLYVEIFTEMSNHSVTEEVKNNLKNAVKKVQKLRDKYKGENELWRDLQDINLIKVKNGTVQKGALNDFLMVFDLAY